MSFLRNFMDWNKGTEVPEQYYFWTGVSVLAGLVNGRVWTHMGRYEIYPNMYIVLLGPPANGKTSALRRGEKILRAFEDLNLSAQAETPEGLQRYMRDKCIQTIEIDKKVVPYTPITCYLAELSNFFGRDPGGMIDLLTGMWDFGGESFIRRTKGQGEDILPRPNMNLLGCTTQDWISTYLKSDIIGGGFTRRVVFVNEMMTDDSNRVSWPIESPEQIKCRNECIIYGKELRKVKGCMALGEGARAWWDNWYNTRPISKEFEVRGYHKSKPVLLLKVAMLLALSETFDLTININDLELALALLDKSETHLTKVFQSIGRNELNTVANRALEYIRQSPTRKVEGYDYELPTIPEKQLIGLLFKDAAGRDVQEIIQHLITTEKIIRVAITGAGVTRTFICYKEKV